MKILFRNGRRYNTGFGIVEIMIALGLGVIIILGVTQIATNNSKTRWEVERYGRQMESAAYAIGLIETDLTNAGFWGEMGAKAVTTVPPICPTAACDRALDNVLAGASCQLNWALSFPVQGGAGNFSCNTVETEAPVDNTVSLKTGTDFLAIRRANSCAEGEGNCEAAAGNFHLQVQACFETGAAPTTKPGIDYFVSTDMSTMTYQQRDCDAANPAPRYRLLNRIYFLSPADQLMRAELVGSQYVQTALVDGVEWLQFEYGMDTNGDGQVDRYTLDPTVDPADTGIPPTSGAIPAGWADVVMVRVSLIVRNMEPSLGYVDTKTYSVAGASYSVPSAVQNHRRELYSRTVSLRNVAGRREVQP